MDPTQPRPTGEAFWSWLGTALLFVHGTVLFSRVHSAKDGTTCDDPLASGEADQEWSVHGVSQPLPFDARAGPDSPNLPWSSSRLGPGPQRSLWDPSGAPKAYKRHRPDPVVSFSSFLQSITSLTR